MKNILFIEMSHNTYEFNQDPKLEKLDIHVQDLEMLMGRPNSYSYNEAEEKLITLSKKDYIPKDKDKLYFLPGVTVPRIKLKDLATKRGIKTTRNIEDADVIFGSAETENKLLQSVWYYTYKTSDVKSFVESLKDYMDDHDYSRFETVFLTYQGETIITDYGGSQFFSNSNLPFAIKQSSTDTSTSSERYTTVREGKEELVTTLLNDSNIGPIYHESTILAHVNGDDSISIDKDTYDNIKVMFESSDGDNHILAMEIMANSNYKKSYLYLQMLFLNFSHVIDNHKEKRHVNFKSLLNFLDKSPSSMYSDLDTVMQSLIKVGQFTPENINILLNNEIHRLSISGSYNFFRIKEVTLDEEYLQRLNLNYTFEMPDYVPIDLQEFPESVSYLSTEDETQDDLEEILDNTEESDHVEVGTEDLLDTEITESTEENVSDEIIEEEGGYGL